MSTLIVIRIVPQQAVDPATFTGYLNPPGLGALQLTAFDISFSDPTGATTLGTAAYFAATTAPSPAAPIPIPGPAPVFSSPKYSALPASAIVQQYDLQPGSPTETAFFSLESVANAIITVPTGTKVENIRVTAQWVGVAGATSVDVPADFYDIPTYSGPAPNLNTWLPTPTSGPTDPPQPDPWGALTPPSLYLQIPVPPSVANPFSFSLPSDGTPPAFDALLNAVQQMLAKDPGAAVTASTTATAAGGTSSLQFPASLEGVIAGMSASGAGISPGSIVTQIDATGLVLLNQETSGVVPGGTVVTFTANIGDLSLAQCRNVAYEIVWSQQPPPPAPPDPVEELYSNPPNTGSMLSGTTTNQFEADRQQFEGKLKAYYQLADATADRLTNFVFALSAAVACEQHSLTATEVILGLPGSSTSAASGSSGESEILLTGIDVIAAPAHFAVPAAYFYGLGALLPAQISVSQRFTLATSDRLERVLAQLNTALTSATITDAEMFVLAPPAAINAAQAARRLIALGTATAGSAPLAPLDTLALTTISNTPSGATLSFASTAGVKAGMSVSGVNVATAVTVSSLTAASVTLSKPLLGDVPIGSSIVFTPPYSAGLAALIQSWLDFPATVTGTPSTQTYLAGDDDTQFWPSASAAQPAAFLDLVLADLTEGFILPPPFNVALGDMIIGTLLTSPTVGALAAVTTQQWRVFFENNPAWLPPGSGNIDARIADFIRRVQTFFAVSSGGPSAPFVLATIAPAATGATVLEFAPTKAILPGMAASGLNLPPGETVAPSGVVTTTTSTTVTLTQPVGSPGIPAGASITFRVVVTAAVPSDLPVFPAPSQDWFTKCLTAYGPFTLGSGFNLPQLQVAAATVFPGDPAAQEWIVDALVILDALSQVMKAVALPAPGFAFAVMEALYARGFASAAQMTRLSSDDFAKALTGTVAHDFAGLIYTSASTIAPPTPAIPPSPGFTPVNPDGSLTNCIPPPCTSPLGPVAYLSELLTLSAFSTCEAPLVPPLTRATNHDVASGTTLPLVSTAGITPGMPVTGLHIPDGTTVATVSPTSVDLSQPVTAFLPSGSVLTFAAFSLGAALATRRGKLGDLAASCANLETQLPLIDIVNECLEFMAAQVSPAQGTIYDTSSDTLAGHILCQEEPCPGKGAKDCCHDPERIFAALPEYSTPATPVAANSAVEPAAWNQLKVDFSSCRLPYSQALDVSRTYLRHFRSCRFEQMRTFRKCITEFVLDPVNEPAGFPSFLWRYPVRIDIAMEYLGITPEEYTLLFQGASPTPCAGQQRQPPARDGGPNLRQLYGVASQDDNDEWINSVVQLPRFLAATCLSYCEFYELWQSGFVTFGSSEREGRAFPICEPCCLDQISLVFPQLVRGQESGTQAGLLQLAIFIRLWRKLKESCCFCYSFSQLRDICDVLHLFNSGTINPDFIRQLAAFQMLRDQFCLDLVDPHDPPAATAIDADRSHLLALWVGPTAAKWGWAVRQLGEKVVRFARQRFGSEHRSGEFLERIMAKLDPLSILAGFDPTSASNSWHSLPTHTLRFAEILAKIAASEFTVAEVLYLFTDEPECAAIFPEQDASEALERPLDLPDDDCEFSLLRLRRKLLCVPGVPPLVAEERISIREDVKVYLPSGEEEVEHIRLKASLSEGSPEEWHWRRVSTFLEDELGFSSADVLDLGRHFFPHVLERAGFAVDATSSRFAAKLPAAKTTPAIWNPPGEGPLQYDSATEELWCRVPLPDHSVIAQLTRLQNLNADEQTAVQDLYFQPRAMLALFAVLFPDFPHAARHLIEEREASERWEHFRRAVMLCHRRCAILATHLTQHVESVTRQKCPESEAAALLILRNLFGDENKATSDWEKDDGTTPDVTWTPPANGGAFAALLGLLGTGLVAEYKVAGGGLVWRDISGSMSGFGPTLDAHNAPVPTVLPSLAATITPALSKFVTVHNGILVKNAGGALLGGAQGFDVTWSGALLIEEEGPYEFSAGAAPHCEPPYEDPSKWRVTLKRGSRSWVILAHNWPAEEERRLAERPLRRGAYDLIVELSRPVPDFASDQQVRPLHTGLRLTYAGPDTQRERIAIPDRQLFSILKEKPLGDGITVTGAGAASYLARLYTSSFRDIRRTYQRAFKAVLFAHRLALSGRREGRRISELGYMLQQKARFAGLSYFLSGGAFAPHAAGFDFNFLPVSDNYQTPTLDARTTPSAKRTQAMFDWWERLFDYSVARDDIHRRRDRHLWHLFTEAGVAPPTNPAPLLGQVGIDAHFWAPALSYFQGQTAPVYAVTSPDLEDDRWSLRVWHADRWLRAAYCHFAARDWAQARPDLWASDDPSALLLAETGTGNANLSQFLVDGCIENGLGRRYDELKRVNDGLRLRGRDALVAFLCSMNRVALPVAGEFAHVPRDLSDLLLLDVETGLCEKSSRIEEAITALCTYVRRARLGLEAGWSVSPKFVHMWEREFATFHVWQACKRQHLYKENWIEWSDLEKARGVEAFRFLEENLRGATLSIAAPGGDEWWPNQPLPSHPKTRLLQQREPSLLQALSSPREGLNLIATPERDARPSWITAVPSSAPAGAGQDLPLWMETAIRLGTRFWRVAAAGLPPAALLLEPHTQSDPQNCASCCGECGCHHPHRVDEYYFWLIPAEVYGPAPAATVNGAAGYVASGSFQDGYQDDFYDVTQQQSAVWQDPAQLPQLLAWQPLPAVRLAWCRLHNGEFQQPRRSVFALQVTPGGNDLTLLGRSGDSLTFSVANGIAPQGYADPSLPGFRYDLPTDAAVVLPEVVAPSPAPTFLGPASLGVYPWFLFDEPGESLFPLSPFCPSVAVAKALRSRCRFEAALAWYREAFDPLGQDCTWIDCSGDPAVVPGRQGPVRNSPQSGCCDSTDISCDQARDRSVILQYVETLVEWTDAVMRRGNSPEAFRQAAAIAEVAAMILGEIPRSVAAPEPSSPPKVSDFVPAFPPLNPRLLDLYGTVANRLQNLRGCANAYKLREEGAFFGNDPVREGWRNSLDPCKEEAEGCFLRSPYRFTFLIQKAQEYASRLQELGSALSDAFEKGDAEFLASLRAGQEEELLTIGLEARKDMWRDSDWQLEALKKTKAVSQANLSYNVGLINQGLISGELAFEALTGVSTGLRAGGNLLEAIGGAMSAVGNFFIGVAGFGGTPLIYEQLPIGAPLAFDFASAARALVGLAEIASSTGSLELTESGWQRRLDEWNHQVNILTIEIQQIERQILGAERRRDQSLQELNSQQRQIEQSREVKNFLRDKFTAHDLYLYRQKEISALYAQTYDLVHHIARQAQHAFNLERGYTTRHFLPGCAWDDLHQGLLAGEKLSAALRHMEKAYLDENVREYELSKQFSLRLHFPAEYLRLRTTGYCEIDIPEWMFDQDFPGQYLRQIKSVSLTLPCVTGPYTGVHCRLTLLSSTTRIDPRLTAPPHTCCCPTVACCGACTGEEHLGHEYLACPDDPRIVRDYGAREAIATSSGQNDTGLFQLDFNDPRYLPFEYQGAISKWRIELPRENNYFDPDSLTDAILRLGYLAREGGPRLRSAASAASRHRLPGDGWRFLDVRHEFPDGWHRFVDCWNGNRRERHLRLRMERKLFPFVPGGKEVSICAIAICFAGEDRCDCPKSPGCPCPTHGRRASYPVKFMQRDVECPAPRNIVCRTNEPSPDLYCGIVETQIGPIGGKCRHVEIEFCFEEEAPEIEQIFLMCKYAVTEKPHCG